jgi:hypothetical protein
MFDAGSGIDTPLSDKSRRPALAISARQTASDPPNRRLKRLEDAATRVLSRTEVLGDCSVGCESVHVKVTGSRIGTRSCGKEGR